MYSVPVTPAIIVIQNEVTALTPAVVVINQKGQKQGSKRKKSDKKIRNKGKNLEIKKCIQTKEKKRE
jgi:hypothetical protein